MFYTQRMYKKVLTYNMQHYYKYPLQSQQRHLTESFTAVSCFMPDV